MAVSYQLPTSEKSPLRSSEKRRPVITIVPWRLKFGSVKASQPISPTCPRVRQFPGMLGVVVLGKKKKNTW